MTHTFRHCILSIILAAVLLTGCEDDIPQPGTTTSVPQTNSSTTTTVVSLPDNATVSTTTSVPVSTTTTSIGIIQYVLVGSAVYSGLEPLYHCTEYYVQLDMQDRRENVLGALQENREGSQLHTWSREACILEGPVLMGTFESSFEAAYAEKFLTEIIYMEPDSPIILTAQDNNTTVLTPLAARVMISLTGCEACGYLWRIKETDADIIDLVATDSSYLGTDGITGAPSQSLWQFDTRAPGTVNVILEYGRFQESGFSGDEIENTFHVRIAVADADDIPDSTNRSPQVEIMAPDNAAVFSGNETIWFQGIAVDPEDGILSNDALQWTSSRDGDFGSGNQPGSDNLTIGMHTITLQAVDTEGTVGTDSIIIAIDAADAEIQL